MWNTGSSSAAGSASSAAAQSSSAASTSSGLFTSSDHPFSFGSTQLAAGSVPANSSSPRSRSAWSFGASSSTEIAFSFGGTSSSNGPFSLSDSSSSGISFGGSGGGGGLGSGGWGAGAGAGAGSGSSSGVGTSTTGFRFGESKSKGFSFGGGGSSGGLFSFSDTSSSGFSSSSSPSSRLFSAAPTTGTGGFGGGSTSGGTGGFRFGSTATAPAPSTSHFPNISTSGTSTGVGTGTGATFNFGFGQSATTAAASASSGAAAAPASTGAVFRFNMSPAASTASGLPPRPVDKSEPSPWTEQSGLPLAGRDSSALSGATRALVERIVAESELTCEKMRVMLLAALMDDELLRLVAWDVPIAAFDRSTAAFHPLATQLNGSLLLLWLRLTFGLREKGPAKTPANEELVPAGLQQKLCARIAEGFDSAVPFKESSATGLRDFSIFYILLHDPHTVGHYEFRVALLRALLSVNTNGSARALLTEVVVTPLTRLITYDWCRPAFTDRAVVIADALGLLSQHSSDGAVPNVILESIGHCQLSGAILPHWLLTLSVAQMLALSLDSAILLARSSMANRSKTMQRVMSSVLARVKLFQQMCVQSSASMASFDELLATATGFDEITAWLRTVVASLPKLMVIRDYVQFFIFKAEQLGDEKMAEYERRLLSVLPHLSWSQLTESILNSSSSSSGGSGLFSVPTKSLVGEIASKMPKKYAVMEVVQFALVKRLSTLTLELAEERRKAREKKLSGASSSSAEDGSSSSTDAAAFPPRADLSELDTCRLLTDDTSCINIVTTFAGEVLREMLADPNQPMPQPELMPLFRTLVDAASALRPIDDSRYDDFTQAFCNAPPQGQHPLVVLRNSGMTALSIVVALHEMGVTRDVSGHSFTTLILERGHWAELRAWLSPAYAKYSMPTDWLAERLSPEFRGWNDQRASTGLFGMNTSNAKTPEENAIEDAEKKRCRAEIMLGQATSTDYFWMTWGSAKSVQMIALASKYWQAVHRPQIVRSLEVHLIPDLAAEVMNFLVPDDATLNPPARPPASFTFSFGGTSTSSNTQTAFGQQKPGGFSFKPKVEAPAQSLHADGMHELATSLRALLHRAQTSAIDSDELCASLTSLTTLSEQLTEAINGERFARQLAEMSIEVPR